MRIAVVHDWLVNYAGSEQVLEQILKLYPQADLFSLVDFLPPDQREFVAGKSVNTSFIQHLPFSHSKYRQYLPLMPLAVEQFDLSGYDLVISSSHAVAKGVITGPDQIHVSYIHTPVRYAWDLQHQYLRDSGLQTGLKGMLAKALLHYLRLWDTRTANGVDYFVANSHYISRRVWKVYRREAAVIYPPVDIDSFSYQETKEDFYLTASRMVPYKKIDLIVEAFSQMSPLKLVVIGDGPDFKKIRAKAGPNVEMLGYQPANVLREYMQKAKAFVFAAEEDFGITPVEAQACGTPVIAFGKGGARETVVPTGQDKPSGLFFDTQTPEELIRVIKYFEEGKWTIEPADCRSNALRFGCKKFRDDFSAFIETVMAKGRA